MLVLDFHIGTQAGKLSTADPGGLARYFVTGGGQSYGDWSNKKFDELFAEQARTLDVTRRKALVRRIDDILLEEMPSILPYWKDFALGTAPDVKDYASPPNPESGMRMRSVWLAK